MRIAGDARERSAQRVLRVAVVSGDGELASSLRGGLSAVPWAAEHALAKTAARDIDVFLVDVRHGDRLEFVRTLAQSARRPLVVLGSREPQAATRYLDAGADDYLSCEADAPECAARLRAAARRGTVPGAGPDDVYVLGDVTISIANREVRKSGKLVRLTPTEFRLLDVLVQHANHVVPHYKLMGAVWGLEHLSAKHYLRVYIRHLRRKLESDPDVPRLILTDWGRGYELRVGESRIA